MSELAMVDDSLTDRELVRRLRAGATRLEPGIMPESQLWQMFIEVRRRGVPQANALFMQSIRALYRRRCLSGVHLSVDDVMLDEHRLVDDPYLGDLWKAYKKCIRCNRTGPAAQLLRDIEERLQA
ncbi:MAG: hypothetical protein ACI9MC_002455 [Kiritimatiellia bacterium]|jgi:hypothetical protein